MKDKWRADEDIQQSNFSYDGMEASIFNGVLDSARIDENIFTD